MEMWMQIIYKTNRCYQVVGTFYVCRIVIIN